MNRYIKYLGLFIILVLIGIVGINFYNNSVINTKDDKVLKIEKKKDKDTSSKDTKTDTKEETTTDSNSDNTNTTKNNEESTSTNNSGADNSTNTSTNNNTASNSTTSRSSIVTRKSTVTYEYPNGSNNSSNNTNSITSNSNDEVSIYVSEEEEKAVTDSTNSDDTFVINVIESTNNSNSTTSNNTRSTNNSTSNSSSSNSTSNTNNNSSSTTNNSNSTTPFKTSFTEYSHLQQYNQSGKYSGYSVCASGGNTIGATGCGLSAYMATRYILTGKDTNYLSFAREACSTGFYNGKGTSWSVSMYQKKSFYENKYGITSKSINGTYSNIVNELKKGNVISMVIGCGTRNISKGGFNASTGWHFVVLAGYDEASDKIYVYNPNNANHGWKSKSIIEKYVTGCKIATYSVSKTK